MKSGTWQRNMVTRDAYKNRIYTVPGTMNNRTYACADWIVGGTAVHEAVVASLEELLHLKNHHYASKALAPGHIGYMVGLKFLDKKYENGLKFALLYCEQNLKKMG